MQTIPSAVQTLLKSRQMTGDNRPNSKITIGGAPAGNVVDFDSMTAWKTPQTGTLNEISVAKKADGKLIFVSMVSDVVYEGEVADVATLLASDNTVTGWGSTGIAAVANGRCCVFEADGELWLSVSSCAAPSASTAAWYKLYKSPSGNGGDWALFSTVYSVSLNTPNGYGLRTELSEAGAITVLDSGRYCLVVPRWQESFGCLGMWPSVWTSDNKGASWTLRLDGRYGPVFGAYYHHGASKDVVQITGGNLYWAIDVDYAGGGILIYKSVNEGTDWTDTFIDYGDPVFSGVCYGPTLCNYLDGFLMFGGTYGNIDQNLSTKLYNFPDPNSSLAHVNVKNITAHVADYFNKLTVVDNTLICCSGYAVLGFDIPAPSGPKIKSISIDRSSGMTAQATIVLDNKGGIYSPDGAGNWHDVLMPNVLVEIEQGYGADLCKMFTGYIDSVEMSTFPAELTITCRDKGKLALDRIVTNAVDGGHYVKYTGATIEAIFTALAGLCGLTTGTIGATGMTLTSKLFSWESYADAFGWLADIAGFEWHVDELGAVHFKRDVMPVSPTVVYAFAEGEDIISLGYTISDQDLYYSAVVYGTDANGAVVQATANFGAPLTYNLFSQKVLKIDAPDARTVAECQEIADRAVALMICRARVVSFAAVAVPYLQKGDWITVTETSTTISEMYRVTDLSFNQDPSGFTMSITCYWYGEVPS